MGDEREESVVIRDITEESDDGYRPIKKNLAVKIICYILCLLGIVFGPDLPLVCWIFLVIRCKLIDREKYDTSWYLSLKTQMGTVAIVWVFLNIII